MSKDSIKLSPKYVVNPFIAICFWCREDVGVAMLGKLPDDAEAPRKVVLDYEPCEKCQAKMDMGITLIESTDGKTPTGNWLVIPEEMFKEMVSDPDILASILKARKAFIDTELFENLIKEEEE